MRYDKINRLGTYASIDAVWKEYPNGGIEGDYVTVAGADYGWDKYCHQWIDIANPVYPDDPGTEARDLKTFMGNVTVNNDLTVAGVLKARGIKQPNMGLYKNEASLNAAIPSPEDGMWAAVGDTLPAYIYRAENGKWVATGETGGVDKMDAEQIDELQGETAALQKYADIVAGVWPKKYPEGDDDGNRKLRHILLRSTEPITNYAEGEVPFNPDDVIAYEPGTELEITITPPSNEAMQIIAYSVTGSRLGGIEINVSKDSKGKSFVFERTLPSNFGYYRYATYSKADNLPTKITVTRRMQSNAVLRKELDVLSCKTIPQLEPCAKLDEVKGFTTKEPIPSGENATKEVTVSTGAELAQAIADNTGEHLVVNLESDIELSQGITVDTSKSVTIQGNDYDLRLVKATVTDVRTRGLVARGRYSGELNGKNTFAGADGTVMHLSQTKYYTLPGMFYRGDGTEATYDNGNVEIAASGTTAENIRKFELPAELQGIEIAEGNNVFVNFSAGYLAYNMKVVKTEMSGGKNWLLFDWKKGATMYGEDYDSYLALNNGYHFSGGHHESFCLINYEREDGAVYVDAGGNIEYPAMVGELKEVSGTLVNKSGTGTLMLVNVNPVAETVLRATAGNAVLMKCEVRETHGWFAVEALGTSKVWLLDSYIHDTKCSVIYGSFNSYISVENCSLKRVQRSRCNMNAIQAQGKAYIANNYIEDFAGRAIAIGHGNQSHQQSCSAVVEHNTLRQTAEQYRDYQHRTLMDSGAITINVFMTRTVIRYNIIYPYTGGYRNSGIYCDDGAINFYIYNNIIGPTPNHYSIWARYAYTKYPGEDDAQKQSWPQSNTGKVVAQNVVCNGINLAGRPTDVEANGCVLGQNLIGLRYKSIENQVNNVAEETEQLEAGFDFADGIVQTNIDLSVWFN